MTIEILALKIVYVPYENVVLKYSNSRSSGGIIINNNNNNTSSCCSSSSVDISSVKNDMKKKSQK